MDEAENQVNDLEHKEAKKKNKKNNNQPIRTRRKKNPKNGDSVSSLWDDFQCSNIGIIRVPEGE